jgi:general secretion pathway protein G
VACSREKLSPEVRQVKTDLQLLRDAVTRYKAAHRGQAPRSLEDLIAPGMEGTDYLGMPLPRDPWQHPYVYQVTDEHGAYNVRSLGRDGMEGGYGADADVDLEMLRAGRI